MFKLFKKNVFFITQKHKNRFVLIYANYNFYTPKKHTKKSKSKIKFKNQIKRNKQKKRLGRLRSTKEECVRFPSSNKDLCCVFFYFIFLIIKLYILYFFMARAIPYGVCLI